MVSQTGGGILRCAPRCVVRHVSTACPHGRCFLRAADAKRKDSVILRTVLLFASVICLIAVMPDAYPVGWYVDASIAGSGDGRSWQTAFKSVQEGIDAASDGDSILVAEGTYVENIHFHGKNVALTCTLPQEPLVVKSTILDGNGQGPVVSFSGTEGESCVLAGFTIRNGEALQGGGIYGKFCKATIRSNVIAGNTAQYRGGGLYGCHGIIRHNIITGNAAHKIELAYSGCGAGLYNCDGLIQGNTISRNIADGNGGALHGCDGTVQDNIISQNTAEYGGGLSLCHSVIMNNTITDNAASYEGGGLSHCDGLIENNTVSGNSASSDEGGGLAYCDGTIRSNTITGNAANYGGGVSYCQGTVENNTISANTSICGGGLSFCNGVVRNNTISENTAERSGGGLYYCNGTIDGNVICDNLAGIEGGGLSECYAVIHNNLILHNSAVRYGGGVVSCRGPIQNNTIVSNASGIRGGGLDRCRGTFGNCIVWGNDAPEDSQMNLSSEPVHCCIQEWDGGGEGNMASDPLFVDSAGDDYRLQDDSPCVDVGANYYWYAWPQRDLEGNCRLVGETIDMGCYEWGATLDTDGDLLCDDEEMVRGTERTRDDTDEDGLRDGLEVQRGTDPRDETPPRLVQVPADIPRIQAALLLGVKGEEIVVAPGTYRETLHFCGADVILRSSDPEDPTAVCSTILDGDEAGPAVSFSGGESEACVLSGFTITGGLTDSGAGIRGGPPGRNTHATIQNNVIANNRAARKGGGLSGCDGVIRRNTIRSNYALRHGGGLAYCGGTIRGNAIIDNSAGGCGGGLYCCGGVIENNHIAANTAEGTFVWRGRVYGDGGGMALCDGTIRNNLVTGNWALHGGGLHMCSATMVNNTIAANYAKNHGGAMDSCKGFAVRNCIVWGNMASEGPQLYDSSPVLFFSCVEGLAGGGETNIAKDPRFVDPDGPDDDPDTYEDNDYRLSHESPCIDTGSNEDWMRQAVDLDGNPRILHGTTSLTVDMGAYEFASAGPFQGRRHVDGSVSASGDGASWGTAFATIQEGVDAASDGHMVLVAPGSYFENIRFGGKKIVLRSKDPLDPAVVSKTIIDGGRRASAVTFLGTEDGSSLLAGFTIRYGKAPSGGGICGGSREARTHATIRNNVIMSNSADNGGGLAFCDGIIEDNTISSNSAVHQYGEGGALMWCDGTIQNNLISGNSSGWRGGGLSRCNGTIQNNAISENSSSSGGGMAYCGGYVQSNLISGNSARVWGGGLHWCDGTIQNNIIVGNAARDAGGALSFCDGIVGNNTVIGNTAENAGGGLAKCEAIVRNCIIWGNSPDQLLYDSSGPQPSPPDYCCIADWEGSGAGNIVSDPQLTPEYRLSDVSPCIDAGMNEEWMRRAVDFEGNPRLFQGKYSCTVDMGAHEYGSFPFRTVEIAETGSGDRRIIWTSRSGDTYVVWSSPELLPGLWTEKAMVQSEGDFTSWTDTDNSSGREFYRIGIE